MPKNIHSILLTFIVYKALEEQYDIESKKTVLKWLFCRMRKCSRYNDGAKRRRFIISTCVVLLLITNDYSQISISISMKPSAAPFQSKAVNIP